MRPNGRRFPPGPRALVEQPARQILDSDYLHVDTVLLQRGYVLFVLAVQTRAVHIVGSTAHPTGAWSGSGERFGVSVRGAA